MDLNEFITNEELEINKDIDTVAEDAILKSEMSLLDMIEKRTKVTKKMTPVYLDENTVIKLKAVAYKNNLSVANILETAVNNLTKNLEVDRKSASLYDKKIKGNRGKKKTTEQVESL